MLIGNNVSTRIARKGTVNIDNGISKAQKVLYVEGLKKNIMIISEMCDQGCDLTFNSKKCEIRSVYIGKMVEKDNKNSSNLYILDELEV